MKLQAVESAGHVLIFLRDVSFAPDILGNTHCCSLVLSFFFGCGPSREVSNTSVFRPLPPAWAPCLVRASVRVELLGGPSRVVASVLLVLSTLRVE